MNDAIITELVKFSALETTTHEQLFSKADVLNNFMKKQDGYLDGELVKGMAENTWYFVYHFESLGKVKAIGEKMRSSKVFDEFFPLTVPGSVAVTLYQQMKKW